MCQSFDDLRMTVARRRSGWQIRADATAPGGAFDDG